MLKYFFLTLATAALAACASTSNSPGPEGTRDHKAGYDLGRSDAVKQQYWIVQDLQKEAIASSPKASLPKMTELPITIPGQTVDGVTTVTHTETIRIEQ